MRETLRLNGQILSATVSRVADKWFVSIRRGNGACGASREPRREPLELPTPSIVRKDFSASRKPVAV
jgi:hypothetical protein